MNTRALSRKWAPKEEANRHVMQTGMAMTAILQERVPEGPNALLEIALTRRHDVPTLYFKSTDGVVDYPKWLIGWRDCISHKQLLCGKSDQVLHLYSFGRSL
ncbi:hypothetical protein Tco_0678393 [Tanacetum coccineum]|uniref:Uncharacterized protein n=1 Tax=Tanacetum coccineum TaxID=301880 RepID=A0ABQ4XEX6_9ASTR